MHDLKEMEVTIQADGVNLKTGDGTKTQAYLEAVLRGVTPSLVASNGYKILADDKLSPSMQFESHVDTLSLAAKRAGVTLDTLTKCAWVATLRKFLRQNDIIVGQVLLNGKLSVNGSESLSRETQSVTPCRIQMDDSKPVIALLETIQLDPIQPSYVSHVEMKKWSGVQGELFDTLYAFQQQVDAPQSEVEAYVPHVEDVEDARGSTSYALELEVSVAGNTMLVNASRDVSRLSLTQLRLILDEFQFSLGQVCNAHQMLRESCFGPQVPLAHELLHQAFEGRAVTKPDLIAVEYEDE
ncbi:hypothetical protein LEN26_003247, partial [Aphanomyces euteiches]